MIVESFMSVLTQVGVGRGVDARISTAESKMAVEESNYEMERPEKKYIINRHIHTILGKA